MADRKVTELTALSSVTRDDLLLVVNDPGGASESRKITIGNFFGTIPAVTSFRANVAFTGTTVSFTANTFVKGTNILNAVNDRLQVANAAVIQAAVNDRLQVANAAVIQAAVNDRLQVANAAVRYANSTNSILTGRTTVLNMTANSVSTKHTVSNTISSNAVTTTTVTATNAVSNTVNVTSNKGFRISAAYGTPASSNAATEGVSAGTIFYSNNFIYIATDANTIKRIQLDAF